MEGMVGDNSGVRGGLDSRKFRNGSIWWIGLPIGVASLSHCLKFKYVPPNFVSIEIETTTKTTCVTSHILVFK